LSVIVASFDGFYMEALPDRELRVAQWHRAPARALTFPDAQAAQAAIEAACPRYLPRDAPFTYVDEVEALLLWDQPESTGSAQYLKVGQVSSPPQWRGR
jgi:hypothetical protein